MSLKYIRILMIKKVIIHRVHISSSFMKFLNKHENTIIEILNIVSSFKKFTPNIYLYSLNNPPPRATYKYTEKLLDVFYIFLLIIVLGVLLLDQFLENKFIRNLWSIVKIMFLTNYLIIPLMIILTKKR